MFKELVDGGKVEGEREISKVMSSGSETGSKLYMILVCVFPNIGDKD